MKSSQQLIQKKLQQHIVLLFDWDNTIMASGKWVSSVYEKTAEDLRSKNIFLKSGATIPPIPTGTTEEILESLFGKENLTTALEIYNKNYNEMYQAIALKMLAGAKEMLQRLDHLTFSSTQQVIVHAAIITSHHRPGIEEHFQLRKDLLQLNEKHKIFIVGKTCVKKPKPDIESGLLVLQHFNLSENQPLTVLMFGDGISDIDFAKNFNKYLQEKNSNSSCEGILFNALFSGDVIFNENNFSLEMMKYMRKKLANPNWESKLLNTMQQSGNPLTEEQLHGLPSQSETKEIPFPHHIVCGYAGVFKHVSHAVTPHEARIAPNKLIEVKLQHVETRKSRIFRIAQEQYLEDRRLRAKL